MHYLAQKYANAVFSYSFVSPKYTTLLEIPVRSVQGKVRLHFDTIHILVRISEKDVYEKQRVAEQNV